MVGAFLSGLLVQPTPTAAQEAVQAGASETFLLRGEVRDFLTEMPIEGAVVQVAEVGRAQVTDANGYFEFPELPAGDLTFVTASFGYETNREGSTVGPGNIMLVRLNPMAVVLPGITVEVTRLMEQLETRRLMTASTTTVFEQRSLEFSQATDVTSYVNERTSLEMQTSVDDQLCVQLTPGANAVRMRVYLDEAPVPTAFLGNFQPREGGLIEVYERLAMVRIYTPNFLQRAAEAGFIPAPINLMEEMRPC